MILTDVFNLELEFTILGSQRGMKHKSFENLHMAGPATIPNFTRLWSKSFNIYENMYYSYWIQCVLIFEGFHSSFVLKLWNFVKTVAIYKFYIEHKEDTDAFAVAACLQWMKTYECSVLQKPVTNATKTWVPQNQSPEKTDIPPGFRHFYIFFTKFFEFVSKIP